MKLTLIFLFICNACFGQHRKHVLGTMYMSYPPIYNCLYCPRSTSPYQLIPKRYSATIDGYQLFLKYLHGKGLNSDSFFVARWNQKDTSCISSEIWWYKLSLKKKK